MSTLSTIRPGSLFFAPMEGITDEAFRKTILKLYPEWDYLACDFLRVPSAGKYPLKHLIKHFGRQLFENYSIQEKTLFQILTSPKAHTVEMISDLENLKVPWIDLNLGCPSNTVCKNGGGSFLLNDHTSIKEIVSLIRKNFTGRFSAKVRTGFNNTSKFEDLIKLLNDLGVEMITVHGRTREQMYKEPADWSYIKKAVKISRVPIIGNGDIWQLSDINKMFNETECHGVMIARGALQSPWIAKDFRNNKLKESNNERIFEIKNFFLEYQKNLLNENISERGLLKQSKSLIRFMFNGILEGEEKRRHLLLTQNPNEFYTYLYSL